MGNSCCLNCTKRKLHCHSQCADYAAYWVENEKRKAQEREKKRTDASIYRKRKPRVSPYVMSLGEKFR